MQLSRVHYYFLSLLLQSLGLGSWGVIFFLFAVFQGVSGVGVQVAGLMGGRIDGWEIGWDGLLIDCCQMLNCSNCLCVKSFCGFYTYFHFQPSVSLLLFLPYILIALVSITATASACVVG
ncbi:hypothetical protein HDK64DRAFT_279472 [Phyllosticta capitalensis]